MTQIECLSISIGIPLRIKFIFPHREYFSACENSFIMSWRLWRKHCGVWKTTLMLSSSANLHQGLEFWGLKEAGVRWKTRLGCTMGNVGFIVFEVWLVRGKTVSLPILIVSELYGVATLHLQSASLYYFFISLCPKCEHIWILYFLLSWRSLLSVHSPHVVHYLQYLRDIKAPNPSTLADFILF